MPLDVQISLAFVLGLLLFDFSAWGFRAVWSAFTAVAVAEK